MSVEQPTNMGIQYGTAQLKCMSTEQPTNMEAQDGPDCNRHNGKMTFLIVITTKGPLMRQL